MKAKTSILFFLVAQILFVKTSLAAPTRPVTPIPSPAASANPSSATADSLLPVASRWSAGYSEKALDIQLTAIESSDHLRHNHHKTLSQLLAIERSGFTIWTKKIRGRLYTDIGRVSTRLRLYSLAARSYYNAWKAERDLPTDSLSYQEQQAAESIPTQLDSLLAPFDDGRTTQFYTLLIHVKQPVPGRRKSFTHINNVGHTFITLVKYNTDGTHVSRSFGFYPVKSSLLAATPFHPTAPSVFKDDRRHEWDETIGKFITPEQFRQIVQNIQTYNHTRYNLNHNNCTSFGLAVARIGGIEVRDAVGRWPFGKGANPGSAGQSIMEGKLTDNAPQDTDGLFILNNVTGEE